MKIELAIIFIVLAAGAGFLIGNLLRKKLSDSLVSKAEELASRIVDDAKREAETISKEAALQAKDVVYQAKADFEREAKEKHKDLQSLEKRLQQKEENLDKKMNLFDQRDADLTKKEQGILAREQSLAKKEDSLDALAAEQRTKLEQISGMTSAEAKKILMDAMESEAKLDAAKRIKAIEEEARETADKKSKEIISLAVQRYAGEYVAEKTVSVVALPSDEMKGRIIGREGRNIRALEAATGIDLIIDDTPEAVILSGFNPVRREVAKIALEKLIADGRIHPGRIEEVVAKAEEEVEQAVKEAGDQAAFDLGVHGIHPEDPQTHRSVEIPYILQPERIPALAGGRLSLRHHGLGTGRQRQAGKARRSAPRLGQGGGPRGRRIPRGHRRRTCA